MAAHRSVSFTRAGQPWLLHEGLASVIFQTLNWVEANRLAGKVFERHRAAVVHQRAQQLPADFDALDAALGAVGVNSRHGRLAVWLFVHEEGIRHELISGLHCAHSLSANSFALNE